MIFGQINFSLILTRFALFSFLTMRISMCFRDVNLLNKVKSGNSNSNSRNCYRYMRSNDRVNSKRTYIDMHAVRCSEYSFFTYVHTVSLKAGSLCSILLLIFTLACRSILFIFLFIYVHTVSLTAYSCSCHGLSSSPIGVYAVRYSCRWCVLGWDGLAVAGDAGWDCCGRGSHSGNLKRHDRSVTVCVEPRQS